MITIILHKKKDYRITTNILCLWFITFVKADLLKNFELWVEKYEYLLNAYNNLKCDYKIVNDLLHNNKGNGYKKASIKRKSNKGAWKEV